MLEGIIKKLVQSIDTSRRELYYVLDWPDSTRGDRSPTNPGGNYYSFGQQLSLTIHGMTMRYATSALKYLDEKNPALDSIKSIQFSYRHILDNRMVSWKDGEIKALETAVYRTGIPLSPETIEEGYLKCINNYHKSHDKNVVDCGTDNRRFDVSKRKRIVEKIGKQAMINLNIMHNLSRLSGYELSSDFVQKVYSGLLKNNRFDAFKLFNTFSRVEPSEYNMKLIPNAH